MSDDIGGWNRPAVHNAMKQRFQRLHLWFGKRVAAAIGKFDPDGMAVHIGYARPFACPRMPSAHRLIDQLLALSGFRDQPMSRNLGLGVAKPITRGGATVHAGVMQNDQRRANAAPPFAEIRRR